VNQSLAPWLQALRIPIAIYGHGFHLHASTCASSGLLRIGKDTGIEDRGLKYLRADPDYEPLLLLSVADCVQPPFAVVEPHLSRVLKAGWPLSRHCNLAGTATHMCHVEWL